MPYFVWIVRMGKGIFSTKSSSYNPQYTVGKEVSCTVASHHQICSRTIYYIHDHSMIGIPHPHGQIKVSFSNNSITREQREHTWSSDHLYLNDVFTGSGLSCPALTLHDDLLWKTNNHLCQFAVVSSNTLPHTKTTINQSRRWSGGGFENIGLTHQNRN